MHEVGKHRDGCPSSRGSRSELQYEARSRFKQIAKRRDGSQRSRGSGSKSASAEECQICYSDELLGPEPIFSADIGTDSGAPSSLSFVDSGTGVTPCSTEPSSSIPKEVTELDVLHLRSHTSGPSISGAQDFAFLYFTLLSCGAVPAGFLDDFLKLEIPARKAAARLIKLNASISDAEAELSLERKKRMKLACARESTATCDQLLVAADIKPRRFKSRLQRSCYEGPTAREDAESAERMRWISLLADLLRNTQTPILCLLRENPPNSQLGGGRRSGTLRSRLRAVQKFLSWLVLAHNLPFPDHWRQLIEYVQVRLSEPCVRGSLKLAHLSFVFLQEVAGVEEKLTDAALYDVTKKELLASALPGREPRQAPRFPVVLLAALEENVMAEEIPVFWRVMSWWMLLQS